jgi:hypothetical protein
MSNFSFLEEREEYLGSVYFEDELHYVFFKKDGDKIINLITNEPLTIQKFYAIEYGHYNKNLLQYIKNFYLKNKITQTPYDKSFYENGILSLQTYTKMTNTYLFPVNTCYKASYERGGKLYRCFLRKLNDEEYGDVLTDQIIKVQEIYSIEYKSIDIGIVRYLIKMYQLSQNKEIFSEDEFFDKDFNTIILHYKILKFFNLDWNELFEPIISDFTKEKVLRKWKWYIKRRLGEKNTNIYVDQLKLFQNIIDILCFMSEEMVANEIIPFWNNHIKIHFQGSYRWMRACTELLESYNKFGYTYTDIELGKNWEKYKIITEENFYNVKNEIINSYKNKCLEKINERIVEAFDTLEKELNEAEEAKDEDLKIEIKFIKEELESVNKTITEKIQNLPSEIDVIYSTLEWWPDILYPVPEIDAKDEDLDRYEHAKKLMIYFRDFVNDF